MPLNRFDNALYIQMGACNPRGIALALHTACTECIREGANPRTDPAVRLIAHQLAFLLNVRELDTSLSEYSNLDRVCREKATEFSPIPEQLR